MNLEKAQGKRNETSVNFLSQARPAEECADRQTAYTRKRSDGGIPDCDALPSSAGASFKAYNDHRMAKSIENTIDFAAKRQVWQRMILKIIRPMLIAMSIWQNSRAVLLRGKAARRKAFWLFAIL